MRRDIIVILIFLAVLPVSYKRQDGTIIRFAKEGNILDERVLGTKESLTFLDEHGSLISLSNPTTNIRYVEFSSIPAHMAAIRNVTLKKRLFVSIMLPLILLINEEILDTREFIQNLNPENISEHSNRLHTVKRRYNLDDFVITNLESLNGFRKEALRRIDILPPSLMLAQATLESGWGTSRFIRQAKNIFGFQTQAGEGLIPNSRLKNDRRTICVYENLLGSLDAYVRMFGRTKYYTKLLDYREKAREEGKMPDSYVMAGMLEAYSESPIYASKLRRLIKANNYKPFDKASLIFSENPEENEILKKESLKNIHMRLR